MADLFGHMSGIAGHWSLFFRICSLNHELNSEWEELNEEIWVRLL